MERAKAKPEKKRSGIFIGFYAPPEIVSKLDAMAKREARNRTNMLNVLLAIALADGKVAQK